MLGGELALERPRRARRAAARAPGDRRRRWRSGRWTAPALLGLLALSGLALGVPRGLARLLDDPRRLDHAAVRLDPHRGAGTRPCSARAAAVLATALAVPVTALAMRHRNRLTRADRAARLPAPGAPRPGGRARARVVLGALRAAAVPERARADRRLRDPVPAARRGRRALGDGAGPAEPRGGGTLAGPPAGRASGGG